jgi:hypothetical protein
MATGLSVRRYDRGSSIEIEVEHHAHDLQQAALGEAFDHAHLKLAPGLIGHVSDNPDRQ